MEVRQALVSQFLDDAFLGSVEGTGESGLEQDEKLVGSRLGLELVGRVGFQGF